MVRLFLSRPSHTVENLALVRATVNYKCRPVLLRFGRNGGIRAAPKNLCQRAPRHGPQSALSGQGGTLQGLLNCRKGCTTDRGRGVIGVDLNAGYLAVAETDPSGNWVRAWRVPLVTYGKTRRQVEALIGDAVASVVEYARAAGKPIVIEKLDFRGKKAALEGESRRYSRMLSSFSYGKVKAYFLSRGYREGVEIHQVNPAFSSVIGRVKFMARSGLSVHQAAAMVLARRLLRCSERIPRRRAAPVGNGAHVAFTVPVRKRAKHVWTYWGAVWGQLRPALAAQHRLGKRRRRPNPVQAVMRTEVRGVA